MSQDCKRFEDSLLELAYGELEETAADELRMHATECHKCRVELESILLTRKLAAQLPIAEPKDDLDSVILQAATKQADEYRIESEVDEKASVQSSRDPRSKIVEETGVVEWLRTFLLRPAFATAALAALVFVFTFFLTEKGMSPVEQEHDAIDLPVPVSSLDEAKGVEQNIETPTKEKAGEGEAVQEPTQDDAPKIEELMKGKKKEGERSREESELSRPVESKSSRRSAGAKGDFADLTAIQDAPRPVSPNKLESTGELSDDLDGVLGGGFAAPPPSGSMASSGGGGAGRSSDSRNINQEASPVTGADLEEEVQAPAPASAPAPTSESVDMAQTASSETASNTETDFEIGIAAYSRGDCRTAVASFSRVVEQSSIYASNRAYAMHHIAKCEKRRGKFASAETWYDKLLILYPSYNGRAEALFESAKCLIRIGKPDRARKRLRELTDIPAWTERAKRELERISD